MVIENIWLTNIDKKQRKDLINGILIKGSVIVGCLDEHLFYSIVKSSTIETLVFIRKLNHRLSKF